MSISYSSPSNWKPCREQTHKKLHTTIGPILFKEPSIEDMKSTELVFCFWFKFGLGKDEQSYRENNKKSKNSNHETTSRE